MRSIYTALVVVVGLLLTGTSFAATINVPGDYPTIQQAINESSDGDVIIVAPGVYAENNVNTNSKSITIQGSLSEDGTLLTTVDGGAGGSVFQVISGEGLDTVIRDLVITGGFTGGDGGGLAIDDSSPSIINCTIIDNEANYGGGIECENSNAFILNCRIVNNIARGTGGIRCLQGAQPTIQDCLIKGNVATGDDGGGLSLFINADVELIRTHVANNNATGRGAGIFVKDSNLQASDCTIHLNNSSSNGGGVGFQSSTGTMSGCEIFENDSGNSGGGMSVIDSDPIFTDCVIRENNCDPGGGGGVWLENLANPTFVNCIISDNTVPNDGGGGIYVNNSTASLDGCLVSDNSASEGVGGVYFVNGGSGSLLNTVVCSNQSGQIGNDWTDLGGNLISENCPVPTVFTVALDGSGDFTSIQSAIDAAANGDTILVGPGVYQESGVSAVVQLRNARVALRGTVDSQTGQPLTIVDGQNERRSFYCTDPTSEGSFIQDIEFTNGYSDAGGAAHVRNAVLTFNGCIFSNSYSFDGGEGVGYGCGGGMYVYLVPQINLLDCVFRDNFSEVAGAGLFLHEVDGQLEGCLFEDNRADDDGGALVAYNCNPDINDCVLSSNSAAEKGGGIAYFAGSGGSLANCEILDNEVTAGNPSSYGGGIYLSNSSPSITGCLVTGNSDPHAGGGLSASFSESIIESCVFSGNTGAHGGLYMYDSSLNLVDCIVVFNIGTSTGGIAMDTSRPVLDGCVVYSNSGSVCGGIGDLAASTSSLLDTLVCSNTVNQICDNYTDLGGNTIEEVCADSDGDGVPDAKDNCDLFNPKQLDCNGNGIGDVCDLADQTSLDCDQNGVPDECDPDCDGDGLIDACETDPDSDQDGIPDNCEPDCNNNTIPDDFEVKQGWAPDCNGNGVPDECDILDEAFDCDQNGLIDFCEIAKNPGLDCDSDGNLDSCQPLDDTTDCDGNGEVDSCELIEDSSLDCNMNGVIDSCDLANDPTPDCDGNGLFDSCEIDENPDLDCDGNGILDGCELEYGYLQRSRLIASDGVAEENLGHGLSVEGNVAIVGARWDDDKGYQAGSAYVYERQSDGSWMEMGKFYADDTTVEDVFGVGVSISNGRVAIGASYDDAQGGTRTGSVYIFDRQADGSWLQSAKIAAPDGVVDAVFGTDVSLDGNRLLVGACLDSDLAGKAGSAFIFEQDQSGQWGLQAKLLASDGGVQDRFGTGVALSGSIAMIGAPKYNGDEGVVYEFHRQSDGTWLEIAKISVSDGTGGDVLGGAIDIDGNRMMACSNRDSGLLYVFNRDSAGVWNEIGVLANSEVDSSESFGYDVCLDGSQLFAGAHGASNENGFGAGEFYVFDITSEFDCDANKIIDVCEIATDPSLDCDSDSILDSCALQDGLVVDCDFNQIPDSCDISSDPLLDQNKNGLLDDCECLADIGGGGGIGDGDGIVSVDDVLVLIGLWGTAGPIGDLNFDDVVGVDDLLLMLEIWGQECDA